MQHARMHYSRLSCVTNGASGAWCLQTGMRTTAIRMRTSSSESKEVPEQDYTQVRSYPIGVIKMEDGGMGDEKIIAIPYGDPTYRGYTDIGELPDHIFEEVRHFFSIYKSLEGKDTVVKEVGGAMDAVGVVEACMENYKQKFSKEA